MGERNMEAASAAPDVWLTLWPVIVGGLLTLLPAVLGQVVVHVLSQRAAKGVRERDQFQKLAAGIAAYEIWIHARTDHKAYGAADPGVSPLPNVMAISALDFPVLLGPLDAVATAALGFVQWQNQAALKRVRGEIANLNDGFSEAYKPFLHEFSHLNDELRVVGVSLNQS